MTPPRPPLKKQPQAQAQEKSGRRVPLMRQLDKVSAEINPLLVIFMIGLGILDLTCYVGLEVSRNQTLHSGAPTAATVNR